MALTGIQIRRTKPQEKPYTLSDGLGLALLINPDGSKGWRFRYRFNDKAKLVSFGSYSLVSLAEAREKRDDAAVQPAAGRPRAASVAAELRGSHAHQARRRPDGGLLRLPVCDRRADRPAHGERQHPAPATPPLPLSRLSGLYGGQRLPQPAQHEVFQPGAGKHPARVWVELPEASHQVRHTDQPRPDGRQQRRLAA